MARAEELEAMRNAPPPPGGIMMPLEQHLRLRADKSSPIHLTFPD